MEHLFEREDELLTASEKRKMNIIRIETAMKFRNVWVNALKRRGLTNVAIAKELDITESTVRNILKKGN